MAEDRCWAIYLHAMKAFLCCSLLLATIGSSAQTTRVLFIGNSYTSVNDLPEMTRLLALSFGDSLLVSSSSPGGVTFQGHTTNATTQNLIDQGNWDFVVLQEQSQLPSFPPAQVATDCLPYAQALVDTVRALSPCAEPVFYMTWGRENGDADNCASWPPVCTYAGMQQQLRVTYLQMAQDNSAECAPAGMAWKRVREDFPGIDLFASDGSHPSVAGTYLVACTMLSTFFRSSTIGATFTSSLDPATAATLQEIASSVVLDSLATWNIGINDPTALPSYTDLDGGSVAFDQTSTNTTSHWWDLGDGSTSDESTFTHTYAVNGDYAVSYVAMNECGRADTSSFTVDVISVGIAELNKSMISIYSDPHGLVVDHARTGGTLELFDVQGRKLASHAIDVGGSERLAVRTGTVVLWRFRAHDGRVGSGVLMVP